MAPHLNKGRAPAPAKLTRHNFEALAELLIGRLDEHDAGNTGNAGSSILVATKLQLVEARTETKFAQVDGKLDQLIDRMADLQTQFGALDTKVTAVDARVRSAHSATIATVIGAAIGIVGLAFAALAIFPGH